MYACPKDSFLAGHLLVMGCLPQLAAPHSDIARYRKNLAAHRMITFTVMINSVVPRRLEKKTGYGAEVPPLRCTICQPATCRPYPGAREGDQSHGNQNNSFPRQKSLRFIHGGSHDHRDLEPHQRRRFAIRDVRTAVEKQPAQKVRPPVGRHP
jgi:hypothetical protein